ncbi:MAG: flagellar basal body rod protein FlgB [Buchnera aphidicola (Eriosoma harunire)]
MLNKIQNEFQINQTALDILAYRQELLASNIANVDTPNYQSQDINFNKEFKKAINKNKNNLHTLSLQSTSLHHIINDNNHVLHVTIKKNHIKNQLKSNHNSVDMNVERMKFIKNALQYQIFLSLLKNQIKNMRNAIQG